MKNSKKETVITGKMVVKATIIIDTVVTTLLSQLSRLNQSASN